MSLTDEPEKEVRAGFDILRAAGHFVPGPEVVSCPTCGRTNINVAQIASEVEERLRGCNKPIKVAVMGCVVNGPGEARGCLLYTSMQGGEIHAENRTERGARFIVELPVRLPGAETDVLSSVPLPYSGDSRETMLRIELADLPLAQKYI